MTGVAANARTGPFFLYDAATMPDPLHRRFLIMGETQGYRYEDLLFWHVGGPGGPFDDAPEFYTVANYGDLILLHRDVDVWLRSLGADDDEEALLRFR